MSRPLGRAQPCPRFSPEPLSPDCLRSPCCPSREKPPARPHSHTQRRHASVLMPQERGRSWPQHTLGGLARRRRAVRASDQDAAALRDATRARTFSTSGHHPAHDDACALSARSRGQPLRCGSSSSSSIFDDELNRRCADPSPPLASHHMTMPSLYPMPPLHPRP